MWFLPQLPPLGQVATPLPAASFCLSITSVFTGYSDALQADGPLQVVEFVAMLLPNLFFRAGTLCVLGTLLQEYALGLIDIILLINIIVTSCTIKNKSDKSINHSSSTLVSLIGVGTLSKDPTKKEISSDYRNGKEKIHWKNIFFHPTSFYPYHCRTDHYNCHRNHENKSQYKLIQLTDYIHSFVCPSPTVPAYNSVNSLILLHFHQRENNI